MRPTTSRRQNNMKDLEIEMSGFIGTELYYRHLIGNYLYTDGIKYLAENANCYWLLDLVGSYQAYKKIKVIPFQLWILTVNQDQTARVVMKEDSDTPVVIKQEIPFTDFPLKNISLYFIDNVLLLPSEY